VLEIRVNLAFGKATFPILEILFDQVATVWNLYYHRVIDNVNGRLYTGGLILNPKRMMGLCCFSPVREMKSSTAEQSHPWIEGVATPHF
jgi:hypothetical protein